MVEKPAPSVVRRVIYVDEDGREYTARTLEEPSAVAPTHLLVGSSGTGHTRIWSVRAPYCDRGRPGTWHYPRALQ